MGDADIKPGAPRDLDKLRSEIGETFDRAFGRTPLRQRLADIVAQASSAQRFSDLRGLREETGDLLCSVLQLITECEWDAQDLVERTLAKIEGNIPAYAGLGRKTVVALYGGAFNPVTNGHIALAKFVLDAGRLFDEVWLMPCYEHLGGKRLVDAHHRLEMCRMAARVDGRIKVNDYEIAGKLKGETFYLLKKLLEEKEVRASYDVSVILGQDNANVCTNWPNWGDVERMARFLIVPRKGTPIDARSNWYLQAPHVYMTQESPVPEISSTEVRDLLVERPEEARKHVDPAVLKYIHDHGLYRE